MFGIHYNRDSIWNPVGTTVIINLLTSFDTSNFGYDWTFDDTVMIAKSLRFDVSSGEHLTCTL